MALVFLIRSPRHGGKGRSFTSQDSKPPASRRLGLLENPHIPRVTARSKSRLLCDVQGTRRVSRVYEHFPSPTPHPPNMSIIQSHTTASLSDNWRTINVDALDPESSQNFDTTTLHSALPNVSEAEVKQLAGQVRQLLRGGDAEGALRGACESAPVGASDAVKVRGPTWQDGAHERRMNWP